MVQKVPTYRLYGEKPADSADFWLHAESLPARSRLHNWQIAAHRHEAFFQLFLVATGSGEMLTDGRSETLAGPCVLFIPPGAVHGFRFKPDVDGIVVTALADRLTSLATADRQVARFATQPRIIRLEPGDSIVDVVTRIAAEAAKREAASNLLIEALMTVALVGLARAAKLSTGSPATSRDQARIEQLETLIGAHLREHRSVGFFASKIGVSATHLNRMARTTTGLSVQEMLANRLLDLARRDLIFTPTPVQGIAYSLGFSDPAYFNRFFRKHTKTTPGKFRASERKRSLA
jgi:AraC family transcriptional activator of pobA